MNKQTDIDKLKITTGYYNNTDSHYALMNGRMLFRTKDHRELKMFVAELEARIIIAMASSASWPPPRNQPKNT